MTGSMTRRIYRHILLLYPEPFRREFGEEMLGVFDQCQASHRGSPYLLADGLFAALRQHVHSFSAPEPHRAELFWEVPPSPALARALATAMLCIALFSGVSALNAKPKAQVWPTLHIERHIWYLQAASVKCDPASAVSSLTKGD